MNAAHMDLLRSIRARLMSGYAKYKVVKSFFRLRCDFQRLQRRLRFAASWLLGFPATSE